MQMLFDLPATTLSLLIVSGYFIGLYFLVGKKFTRRQRVYEEAYPSHISYRGTRLILLFSAILFPLGGIIYENTQSHDVPVFWIMVAPGVEVAFLYVLVVFTKFGKRSYLQILTFSYYASVFFLILMIHYSELEPFFQSALLMMIVVSGLFIYRMGNHIIFSVALIPIYSYAVFSLDRPYHNPALGLFMLVTALLLSILLILLRERLSRDLSFSQAMIQHGNTILIATDKEANVVYISKNFEEYTGYKAKEVLGQGWWNIRSKQTDVADFIEQIRNKSLPTEEISWLRSKDGNYRWIKWSNTVLPSGIVIGLGTDITEKRHYEKTFVDLIEHANDFVYLTDEKGNFSYANASTLLASGYTKEEFFNMHFTEIIAPSHRERVAARYYDQFQKKIQTSYLELPIETKHGEVLWVGQVVKFNFSPVTGDFEGAQAICRNITVANLLKEELESNLERLRIQDKAKQDLHAASTMETACSSMLIHLVTKMDESRYIAVTFLPLGSTQASVYCAERERPELHHYDRTPEEHHFLLQFFKEKLQLYLPHPEHPFFHKVLQALAFPEDKTIRSLYISAFENGKGEPTGYICAASDRNAAYPEYAQLLFKDLSEALSGFYVKQEQVQVIRQGARYLEILNTAKKEILMAVNIRDIHHRLLKILYRDIEHIFRVSIAIFQGRNSASLLWCEKNTDGELKEEVISTEKSITIGLFRDQLVYYKPNLDQEEKLNDEDLYWYEKGVRSVLCMPLFVNNELYAAVNLLSEVADNFTEQHLRIIDEIIDSASVVIGQYIYNDIIREKNKSISDSIDYASRIQQAIIPPASALKELYPHSFVFFQQRDILGGDFYLCGKTEDLHYFIVGDCTGHGVSGALLTMLASNAIQQAIHTHGLQTPSDIVNYLNNELKGTLNQYVNTEAELTDGLDISIAMIDFEQSLLQFSAAMHTAYLVRKGELLEIKGTRLPIGAGYNSTNADFSTQSIPLQTGDELYLSTDGYMDQFNGLTGKKYGRNRFKQLLLELYGKSAEQRKAILLQTHLFWKGSSEQTDDICLLSLDLHSTLPQPSNGF